jgi:hypothetical protein
VAFDNELRVIALLATADEKPIEPIVLAMMRRACELWNEGEKALAQIYLARADLPPCPAKISASWEWASKSLISKSAKLMTTLSKGWRSVKYHWLK